MSLLAKDVLASSMKKLYNLRDNRDLADFVIESKDEVEFYVHSSVLLSRYISIDKLAQRVIKKFLGKATYTQNEPSSGVRLNLK